MFCQQRREHLQDNATPDVFAKPALVTRQLHDLLSLEIEQFNIIHGIKVPMPTKRFETTVAEVVEVLDEELEEKCFKKLGSLTIAEKRYMMKASWGNAVGYAVGGLEKEMLSDDDLAVVFEYMQWQYMQPLVTMVRPAQIKLALHYGRDDPQAMIAMMEMVDSLQHAEFAVLPVHCSEPLHWTVLQLRLEAGKIVEVKYYDWCRGVQESARLAQKLLTLLCMAGASAEMLKLPEQCNWYRQAPGSNDCGFAVWQSLANCFKRARLEGRCGVLPNPKEWRWTLRKLLETMQDQQSKWSMEEAEGKKPKFALSLPGAELKGVEANSFKVHRKEFWTCTSCRWSKSGAGCCYCNPEKHTKLRLEKEQRSRHLAESLKAALHACTDLGLIPEVKEPGPPADSLKGGGLAQKIYINIQPADHEPIGLLADRCYKYT